MNKDLKTKWDLSCFYKSDNDPKIQTDTDEFIREVETFETKWKNRTDYLESPEVLKEALNEFEALSSKIMPPDFLLYFDYKSVLELTNTEIKAKYNKADDLVTKLCNKLEFFSNRISKIEPNIQSKFINSPELVEYKHMLKKSFEEAKYVLSEDAEQVLSIKSKTSWGNWVEMLSSMLSAESGIIIDDNKKKIRLTFEEIMSALKSKETKDSRDSAAKTLNRILNKYKLVAEHELNSILESKKQNDELRKLPHPYTARHISDDIDSEVVEAMVKSVSSNFKIAGQYYKLKADLLGQDKLAYHERNLSIGKIDTKYPYEKGVEILRDVFAKLDKEFLEIYDQMNRDGCIDVFPAKGKRGGAFCSYTKKIDPIFVLLNYTDTLEDVSTIAHEMGHAINDVLMKKQNSLNFGTPMSTAEVSSTFMEDFVLEKLMSDVDKKTALILMMEKLNDDISTIFRQVACYNFELELHTQFREKGYLSNKEIGKLFTKHMSAYMGEFVTQDKGAENWWIYWSHLRNPFYVYSYASGLLISKAMQNKYRKDNSFMNDIKEFLSAGTSDSPKNLFAKMGIDITDKKFWDDGIAEIENLLKETTTLAKELGYKV